jgi:hypothetical protein
MRISHNRPRSRHKLAQWEAERVRQARNGLIVETKPNTKPAESRSLRAASFKEATPYRRELSPRAVRRPKQLKADQARNRAAIAIAATGDVELFRAVVHI